jgi:hypothetical protein
MVVEVCLVGPSFLGAAKVQVLQSADAIGPNLAPAQPLPPANLLAQAS